MHTSRKYREEADKCFRLAECATTEAERVDLAMLAKRWLRLAEFREAGQCTARAERDQSLSRPTAGLHQGRRQI
jgi:hypothetical protein